MKTTLPITGGCACGAIRYTINAQPLLMFQCHCRDCQQATGGLYAPNVWFPEPAIELSQAPKSWEVTSDAGNHIHHDFCETCGSPIGMRTSNSPGTRGIRAASMDDMSWLSPMANIYMKNSPPWEVTNPDLPVHDGQPPQSFIMEMVQRQGEASDE